MPRIIAAGDIGSNTAHLLVGKWDRGKVTRISDTNEWISLGEIVGREGHIPPDVIALLIKTLTAFRRLASVHKADALYVFATEAMRKASNGKAVITQIKKETGVKIELINARREAELGLRGAWADCKGALPAVLVEVGGGSAQVAYCDEPISGAPTIQQESSLPLGTGILIAQLHIQQPATKDCVTKLNDTINRHLMNLPKPVGNRLIACGGVARGLWRALHPDGNRVLHRDELDYLIRATQRIDAITISARFQVKAKRANTLLPGACLYAAAMDWMGVDTMHVSRFGVREGAILEIGEGKIKCR